MGGFSAEREVSLSTGRECALALRTYGYDVIEIDAGPNVANVLIEAQPDVVFNALHGRWGEDGCVQGLLEWLCMPYTHSGVRASANAMDKEQAKILFRTMGLPVPKSTVVHRQEVSEHHVLAPPYVAKPVSEGSSVGIYIVPAGTNGPPQISEDLPDQFMVEAYVPGLELTTTVVGEQALGVTEIVTDGWYDYHAKYEVGGSHHVLPARIPPDITAACKRYALMAHQVLGCRGLSRTDFRWDQTKGLEGLFVLETNTQPGMTPTSLSPEQAAYAGMDMPALCAWLVEDASCAR